MRNVRGVLNLYSGRSHGKSCIFEQTFTASTFILLHLIYENNDDTVCRRTILYDTLHANPKINKG